MCLYLKASRLTLYTKTQFVSYSHCIMAMHSIYINELGQIYW